MAKKKKVVDIYEEEGDFGDFKTLKVDKKFKTDIEKAKINESAKAKKGSKSKKSIDNPIIIKKQEPKDNKESVKKIIEKVKDSKKKLEKEKTESRINEEKIDKAEPNIVEEKIDEVEPKIVEEKVAEINHNVLKEQIKEELKNELKESLIEKDTSISESEALKEQIKLELLKEIKDEIVNDKSGTSNSNINNTDSSIAIDNTNNTQKSVNYGPAPTNYYKVTPVKKDSFIRKVFIFLVLIGALVALWSLIQLLIKKINFPTVKLAVPTTLFVGESQNIVLEASGQENLDLISYHFVINNPSIVSLAFSNQTGQYITNEIKPLTMGEFELIITATINNEEFERFNKKINVCQRLKAKTNETRISVGEEYQLDLNVGNANCYKLLNYKVEDRSIIEVSEKGIIKGKRIGTTTIIVSDDINTFRYKVNVN